MSPERIEDYMTWLVWFKGELAYMHQKYPDLRLADEYFLAAAILTHLKEKHPKLAKVIRYGELPTN